MKLLQINTIANSGSTGRIAEGLSVFAAQQGFESAVAYGRWAVPSQTPLVKIGRKIDCLWHGFESRIFDNHGLASRTATRSFLKKVDEIKPDIIHLHNIHGYYLNYPLLFTYLSDKKIPIVWTLHDCWAFTGHCAHYDFCGCNRWKTQCNSCPQKKSYPASFLFDRSAKNHADKKHFFTLPENMTIVPVSNWLAAQVSESFLKKFPCKVIHNGIDTDTFRPYNQDEFKTKFSWSNKKIILGVASTWSQRKGLDDFIKLSALLPENYQIVLIGLSRKQQKGLPPNISGIPKTESTTELAQIYSAADVFVNPTWEDNYPTTNLEAIACGTPVITYRTGGSIEAISPACGSIVEKGNVKSLSETINDFIKHPKQCYAEHCRTHALTNFWMQDCASKYINLYHELICG